MPRPINVLFLCRSNSANSVIAEAAANSLAIGLGCFRAFSGGSHPYGALSPYALEVLRDQRICVDGLRSKSWGEFAQPDARHMDLVITVCDGAAGMACPPWPGRPLTAHWSVADPLAVEGTDGQKRRAFRETYLILRHRIEFLATLDLEEAVGGRAASGFSMWDAWFDGTEETPTRTGPPATGHGHAPSTA